MGGLAAVSAFYTGPAAALMDGKAAQPTIELGTVQVKGDKEVLSALRAIKTALHTAFSDDPAHANDVVCRINKGMGEAREYLDCATNRNYGKRREAVKTALLVGTLGQPAGGDIQMFKGILAQQPDNAIHMQVNGGALQALLQQIPDADASSAAPAPATAPPPAAATQP